MDELSAPMAQTPDLSPSFRSTSDPTLHVPKTADEESASLLPESAAAKWLTSAAPGEARSATAPSVVETTLPTRRRSQSKMRRKQPGEHSTEWSSIRAFCLQPVNCFYYGWEHLVVNVLVVLVWVIGYYTWTVYLLCLQQQSHHEKYSVRQIITVVVAPLIGFLFFLFVVFWRNNRQRFVVTVVALWTCLAICLHFLCTRCKSKCDNQHLASLSAVCGLCLNMMAIGTIMRYMHTLYVGDIPCRRWENDHSKMMESDAIAADNLRSFADLDTGDLVFTSYSRACTSRLIRFFTRSRWSHVGMIVRNPAPGVIRQYIEDTNECDDGFGFNGFSALGTRERLPPENGSATVLDDCYVLETIPPRTRLMPWVEWARVNTEHFPDEILAVRKLQMPPLGVETKRGHISRFSEDAEERLNQFMLDVCGLQYSKSVVELALSAYGWNWKKMDDGLFCSSLVAEAYKTLGLLGNDDERSNNYTPQHFVANSQYDLRLKCDAELEPKAVRVDARDYRVSEDREYRKWFDKCCTAKFRRHLSVAVFLLCCGFNLFSYVFTVAARSTAFADGTRFNFFRC